MSFSQIGTSSANEAVEVGGGDAQRRLECVHKLDETLEGNVLGRFSRQIVPRPESKRARTLIAK